MSSASSRDATPKRQLTKNDSIASEDYPHVVGRAKDSNATFITCKDCDMLYPTDRIPGFECYYCKCSKFKTHFTDPDQYGAQ